MRTVTVSLIFFLVYSFRLPQSFLFTADFGRDMYQSGRIAQGELVLIGSKMNLGGYFVGPYLYYLLAVPLLISGLDINFVLYTHAAFFAASAGFFFWAVSRKLNFPKALLATTTVALLPLYLQSSRYPSNGYTYLSLLLILFTWVFFFNIKTGFASLALGILIGIIFNIHPTTFFATVFIFLYLILFVKEKKLLLFFLEGFLITFAPLVLFELRHNFVMTKDTFVNQSYRTFTEDGNTPQFWLNKNPVISTLMFLSEKSQKWVLLPPVFFIAASLALLLGKQRERENIKLDLFLAGSAILSLIILVAALRFHFEDHYIFPTLFFVVYASVLVLIRSRFWLLLLAIIFLEITSFPKGLFSQTIRSFNSIEQAVKFSIDQKLVTKGEPFNLIQVTDAYGLVPTGYEYRFFFRKFGFYPISEYDYRGAKKLLIFSETPYYDIDRFKMWATEEFGRENFANRKIYHSGPITIYLISKESAGRLRKMSNLNELARRFAARLLLRGAPTRRASETVGLNSPDEIGIKRKDAKILKNFL